MAGLLLLLLWLLLAGWPAVSEAKALAIIAASAALPAVLLGCTEPVVPVDGPVPKEAVSDEEHGLCVSIPQRARESHSAIYTREREYVSASV